MIDQRIRAIRFWMALAAIALLCLLEPSLWFLAAPMIIPCPSCCGGANCTIFSDDFSADNLATNYTTVSGTWAVASGTVTTTSAGAILVSNATSASGHGRSAIKVKASTVSSTFRAIGSYTDANNYVFSELTISGASSTLKLWGRSGGSNTQIGTTCTFTAVQNTYYDLAVCWDGTNAEASIALAGSSIAACSSAGAYAGTGTKAGVGTTPSGGGTTTVDSYSFTVHHNDDSSCPICGPNCALCTSGTPVNEWQVTIPSFAEKSPGGNPAHATCCLAQAGTYFVENLFAAGDNGVGGYFCAWGREVTDNCNAGDDIFVQKDSALGLFVSMDSTPTINMPIWIATGSTDECSAVVGRDLTGPTEGLGNDCDTEGKTGTISAIS